VKDIHAAMTERFVEQLRAGSVPWQRPWRSVQNIISRKAYRGINSLTLGSTPFGSPFWMTFRQAHELGGHIRKGERSSPVIYWKFLERRDANGRPVLTSKGKPAYVPFIRWSNVFNLDQTEGVRAPELPVAPETMPAQARAEALVDKANLGPIRREGFAATYSPTEDIIRIPAPTLFRSSEDYYHTLFHEMTHATGHASRLDREGITNPIKFASERYSKEELIAELGAAFLSNEAGILDQVRFDNSAAYLQSWIRKLEDDPTLLVSAASHAQRSFDWVTGQTPEEQESLSEELHPVPSPQPALDEKIPLAPSTAHFHETHSTHPPLAGRQEPPVKENPSPHSASHLLLRTLRRGTGRAAGQGAKSRRGRQRS
jgi:antirestriction protein ArdC